MPNSRPPPLINFLKFFQTPSHPTFIPAPPLIRFLWFSQNSRLFQPPFDYAPKSTTEIRKSEIPPSGFCPISGDWDELGIPKMQQNARVTAFTVSELLKENQKAGKITPRFIITTLLPLSAFWVTRCLRSIKLFNAIDNLWERDTTLCVSWNCQGNFSLNS